MDRFDYFLPFSKVDKTAEGHRIVTGYASTPAKDLDGEIITLDAIKTALPGYMEWRNIRQMHQPLAVGITKEASIDEHGLYITGKIVDENAVKLLDEGVLKGFSIGGKKLAKKGDKVTGIDLLEISLVDRPANPECRLEVQKAAGSGKLEIGEAEIQVPVTGQADEVSWLRKMFERILPRDAVGATVYDQNLRKVGEFDVNTIDPEYCDLIKRQFSDKERAAAAETGEAMPGGAYPIKSVQDLKNAIQAIGRAKNPDATRKHIVARAKALGAPELIPSDWGGSTKKHAAALDVMKAHPGLFGDIPPDAPLLEAFAKTAMGFAILSDQPACSRLSKGMGMVSDLAYAFANIRDAQRRLVAEGFIEKDGDDHALAMKLGEIASELATVMATKAEHEGSEATFMTDESDIGSYLLSQGVFEMATKPEDLAKKAAAAKMNFGKVANHLRKAGSAQAAGMACLGKVAQMHGAAMKKAAGDGFDHAAAMNGLAEAHGHFGEAADHMEMAHASMAKVMTGGEDAVLGTGASVVGDHGVTGVSQTTMTEGEVPWYDAAEPYKFAAAKTAAAPAAGAVPEGYITKREAELMAENAGMKATVAALSKTPTGAFKGKSVLMPELTAEGDDMSVLMKGIQRVDQNDPKSVTDAAGVMIGNMIANSGRFGKSVFDPTFRGQAGLKR